MRRSPSGAWFFSLDRFGFRGLMRTTVCEIGRTIEGEVLPSAPVMVGEVILRGSTAVSTSVL